MVTFPDYVIHVLIALREYSASCMVGFSSRSALFTIKNALEASKLANALTMIADSLEIKGFIIPIDI